MNCIVLNWQDFSVDLSRVRSDLKTQLSSNYDGLVANAQQLTVMFTATISDADTAAVQSYWTGLTPTTFATPVTPSPEEIAREAMAFGQNLIISLGIEPEVVTLTTDQMNELMGLAGGIQLMLMTGALGTAMVAIANTDFQGLFTVDLITKYVNTLATYTGADAPAIIAQTGGGS